MQLKASLNDCVSVRVSVEIITGLLWLRELH